MEIKGHFTNVDGVGMSWRAATADLLANLPDIHSCRCGGVSNVRSCHANPCCRVQVASSGATSCFFQLFPSLMGVARGLGSRASCMQQSSPSARTFSSEKMPRSPTYLINFLMDVSSACGSLLLILMYGFEVYSDKSPSDPHGSSAQMHPDRWLPNYSISPISGFLFFPWPVTFSYISFGQCICRDCGFESICY